ncbi:MAG: hypothetical protein LBC55_04090 [Desulfovibrio sp.]|jgi:hypothetical protein|nr:hypothetical protein [Desulfovibrio sp.]
MQIEKLAVSVAFFYRKDKLEFLSQVLSNLHIFAKNVQVYIFTNTSDKREHYTIEQCFHQHDNIKYTILVPKLLGHPFFLTWSHKDIFRQLVRVDPTITYYMYLEDDILLTKENIEYYLEGESRLHHKVFFPSFVRYEITSDGVMYAIDVMKKQIFHAMGKIQYSDDYYYVNFSYPYQGMYLLNSRLMNEYFSSCADNPDYKTYWGIREQNTAVILFHHVPTGFKSRNLVGCIYQDNTIKFDPRCLIHHLPNNYVNNDGWLSQIYTVDELIIP